MKHNISYQFTCLSNRGIAIFLFFLMAVWAGAAEYYVSPSGSDSNPGTQSHPWRTIQHAAEMMAAGDTAWIRDGIYHEQVITERSGSTTDGYIIFSVYQDENPVLDGTGVTTGNTGFAVSHSYIKIIGLEIRNWITGIWLQIGGYTEISDCEIHEVVFGIGAANGAHDFELNRLNIHHFDLYGFDASPSGGAACYKGTINDCVSHTGRDLSQNVDGFALGHGTQHNFVFNRCEAYGVYDGFDISTQNTTLHRCSAHDCISGGFKIWQDNVSIVNCIGYHNGTMNVELDWDGEPGVTTLQNCTFVDAQVYNIWVENPGDHLHMYNCILAGGDNIGLAFEEMGVENYQGDHNIFHNDNPDRAITVGYTDEFSLNQIAGGDWENYSGWDHNSLVSFDPDQELFIDLSNWDFHLVEGSIAIDAGTSVNAPSVDYNGKQRPSGNGYDIGAFEYITQYTVTILASSGGTTYPSPGSYKHNSGSQISIQAIPNPLFIFSEWTGDVTSGNEKDNPLNLTMDSNKSIKANFTRIVYPPLNFSFKKIVNRSLSQTEYIHILTWQANPNNENISTYRIYQVENEDQILLVELNASTFTYWHRHVRKNKTYTYALVAVSEEGRESDAAVITVSN